MIALNNISVTLGKDTQLEKIILSDLSLQAKSGEFIVIIGSNGVGKSTLLNVIAGFIMPDSGEVIIDHQNITQLPQRKRAAIAALVMQDPKDGTIENMTIEENLSFAYCRGKLRGIRPFKNKNRTQYFKKMLSPLDMDLENRMHELVGNLSGGQRQALSLMMAKISNSKILLLDEITAALDPKMAEVIMQLTANLVKEEQRTTVMITHNMSHAINYGDRTLLLANSKIQKIYSRAEKAKMTPIELATELAC